MSQMHPPAPVKTCRLLHDSQGDYMEVANADLLALGIAREIRQPGYMTATHSYIQHPEDSSIFVEAAREQGLSVEPEETYRGDFMLPPKVSDVNTQPVNEGFKALHRSFGAYDPHWIESPLKPGSVGYLQDGRRATVLRVDETGVELSAPKHYWHQGSLAAMQAETEDSLAAARPGDMLVWRYAPATVESMDGESMCVSYVAPVVIHLRSDQIFAQMTPSPPVVPRQTLAHQDRGLMQFNDGEVGWLMVPLSDLKDLNIQHEISNQSRMTHRVAYLENARDLELFTSAAQQAGWNLKIKQVDLQAKIYTEHDIRRCGPYCSDLVDTPVTVGQSFRDKRGWVQTVESMPPPGGTVVVRDADGMRQNLSSSTISNFIFTDGQYHQQRVDRALRHREIERARSQQTQDQPEQAPPRPSASWSLSR